MSSKWADAALQLMAFDTMDLAKKFGHEREALRMEVVHLVR